MKKNDALLNDFLSESIDDQTLSKVIGGGQEWTPTRDESYGSNDAHTSGDEGDCDLDDVSYGWTCD